MPYLVGQRVLFDWEPDGTLHTHQQWEFVCPPGAVIADYVANSSAGAVVPLPLDGGNRGDTTGSGLVTYWTTEGQFPFRSILTYNTQTHAGLHAHKGYPEDPPEQVDIVAPTVAAATLIDRTPVVDGVLLKPFILYQPGSDRAFVKMGERREPNPLHKVGFLACVDVTVDLDPFPGARPDFRFVQLGTVRFDYTTRDGRHLTVDTHVADPALDTRFPYPGDPPEEVGPATWQVVMDDSPEFPLPSRGFSAASASFQFAAYVMFRPYPDGRWVALGRVNWNADITVAKASDAAPWTITSQNRGVARGSSTTACRNGPPTCAPPVPRCRSSSA